MAREPYTAGEAARVLGISLDTLRRWDKQGRIRVQRDAANRRVVPVDEVERLRGSRPHGLSARNRFPGTVESVVSEGVLARVELVVPGPVRVTAVVTSEAVDDLGLRPGTPATAVVKATSIMVER